MREVWHRCSPVQASGLLASGRSSVISMNELSASDPKWEMITGIASLAFFTIYTKIAVPDSLGLPDVAVI